MKPMDGRRERLGSPPRVWGKADKYGTSREVTRITPTCVGKSDFVRINRLDITDHPHVCGEKMRSGFDPNRDYGSPPRVWGKVLTPHPMA